MHITGNNPEVIGPSVEYVSGTLYDSLVLSCKINGASAYSWSKSEMCTVKALKWGMFMFIFLIYCILMSFR